MELKTTQALETYLSTKKIPFDKVTELPGGSANFIWRVQSAGERDTIIKHAEPYIKVAPQMGFPAERMDFETNVIRLLNSALALKDGSPGTHGDSTVTAKMTVALPTIHWYDHEQHVIQMNYAGPRNLKEAYQDPSLNMTAYGNQIGAWLANLHESTKSTNIGDNSSAKEMYRFGYHRLEGALKEMGFDGALGAQINDKYGAMLLTDDECVCHGDCWSGNLLVSEDQSTLTVVDWEMTRRGCGATDVGQFAAEAYLLDIFKGSRGLMESFLQAYKKNTDMSEEFVGRLAVHFAMHICFWPTRVPWGSPEQTQELVQVGVNILTAVEAQDWDKLRGSVLRDVFVGFK